MAGFVDVGLQFIAGFGSGCPRPYSVAMSEYFITSNIPFMAPVDHLRSPKPLLAEEGSWYLGTSQGS